jgi:hypothetical protein
MPTTLPIHQVNTVESKMFFAITPLLHKLSVPIVAPARHMKKVTNKKRNAFFVLLNG